MSEEEKKAIETLKEAILEFKFYSGKIDEDNLIIDLDIERMNGLEKVLNLIEKQQKEIEELSEMLLEG